MKVWITKYALTQGVYRCDVETFDDSPRMVKDAGSMVPMYYHGNDWHETSDEAVAKAEKMRAAKIASLEKQIAKLRRLDFAKMVRD